MKKITIIARDDDNRLLKILNDIKSRGNNGHTFTIDIEGTKHLWDGDGSDKINYVMSEEYFTKGELMDIIRHVTRYEKRELEYNKPNTHFQPDRCEEIKNED